MSFVQGLRCVLCGAEYEPAAVTYVCPRHGNEGILDVIYDYAAIRKRLTREALAERREPSIWRYLELLPVERPDLIPPLQVGWTPLCRARRLGERLGLQSLWVKDDGRNPTASFKDRASAVGVVKALEGRRRTVTAASTGNAASSLAGIAASVGLPTVIFVPERAPEAKVAQLLLFGATVFMVRGSYDQAFDLCLQASHKYGWYSRNTAYNPYLSEGKKTAALEICEQLQWQAPDRIYVSVGDGCIIGGLGKGLRDLLALGLIEQSPRLIGVQAEGSAVLARAWAQGGEEIEPCAPSTLADSISVGIPRDRVKALRAVRETGGAFTVVSDEEILEAMRILAQEAGVFAEPAGAAPLAGLRRDLHEGRVDPRERIVLLVTGNGLKDVGSAIRAAGTAPHRIDPTAASLAQAVKQLGL